ncbi:MAG: hypothetical protein HYT87_13830 [Nitrospirae bacterium]|nr:hypothetical protein [Nitrospirota bacterium]
MIGGSRRHRGIDVQTWIRSALLRALVCFIACLSTSCGSSESESTVPAPSTGGAGSPTPSDGTRGGVRGDEIGLSGKIETSFDASGSAATAAGPSPEAAGATATVIQPPAPEFKIASARGSSLFVFVISPESDNIIRIEADSLGVSTIHVEGKPEEIEVTPDNKTAVVLSPSANTVSLIDVESAAVTPIKVRPGLNRMVLSPGGRFAIAFFDFAKTGGKIAVSGIKTFNEISIVDVQKKSVSSMAIGFNPKRITFSKDSQQAFAITDFNIAIVTLETSSVRSVDFSTDPLVTIQPLQVEVNSTGTYAFILPRDKNQVRAMDLATGAVTIIVPEPKPAGIRLSPDDSIVLVTHPTTLSTFSQIDAAPPFTLTKFVVPGQISIDTFEFAPDGKKAVLFGQSTNTELLSVYNTKAGTSETYPTVKPVRSVRFSPNSRYAVLTTSGGDGKPNSDIDDYFDRVPAFISLDLDTVAQNAVQLESNVQDISFDTAGRFAEISLTGIKSVVVLNLERQVADSVLLPNVPKIIGTLPNRVMGFSVFAHELGQVSFINFDSRAVLTVTGFELNSRIKPMP